jgi:hypothetical protein
MKLSLTRILKENAGNPAELLLQKIDDMVHQMTVEFDESIHPKDISQLIQQYFQLRQNGAPEPMLNGKRGDYLAQQIVSYLKGNI